MTQDEPHEPPFHALLIGIDAYRQKPLYGSVNDIDAVRQLLVERAGIPPERVRCLASPRRGAPRAPAAGEQPATLANLRAALDELAGRAKDGDRVFIYYSGHGVRVPCADPDGFTFHREALVPIDVDATPERRLLFDHELNERLARIAGEVTCIFDCCHAAGATRFGGLPRSLDPRRDLGWISPREDPARGAAAQSDGFARALDGCQVVCACLAHEQAMETPDEDGLVHGLLTRAFLRALGSISDAGLRAVRWRLIWQAMRAMVEGRNSEQHLWMSGDVARPVLIGGPDGRELCGPVRGLYSGDPGLSLRRAGEAYELDAGTLAWITESARIAVYGEHPARFPELGSAEDLAARHGLLRVTAAALGSATAVPEGAPFELPPGARGRVVEAGRAARLRCAILPPNEAIAAALRASPLLEIVDDARAQVRLEQVGGRWLVTDDVHGADPACALLALGPADLPRVRAVLEHYHRYALPLRMAASAHDLPGALRLTVLACARELPAKEAQGANLREAPTTATGSYGVWQGDGVCFRVHNTSDLRLRVTLLNSAASGRVQLLSDEVIDACSFHTFWSGNLLGRPFSMSVPRGKTQAVDRLTAVGTTAMKRDLGYLREDRRFADLLAVTRGGRDIVDLDEAQHRPPLEQWTAARAIVTTRTR